MEKKKGQRAETFTTLDAYQAGRRILKGHSPKLINQGEKVISSFDASDELYKIIAEYNTGSRVKTLHLERVFENLKIQTVNIIIQGDATLNLAVGNMDCTTKNRSKFQAIRDVIKEVIKITASLISIIKTIVRPV